MGTVDDFSVERTAEKTCFMLTIVIMPVRKNDINIL